MRCPFCGDPDTGVYDSRVTQDGAVRRRRKCAACAGRFNTFERPYLRDLIVMKRSGRRQPFDREKLARSLRLAAARRPLRPDDIEGAVSRVGGMLLALGDPEVTTQQIGRAALEALRELDNVAFVRYASVYLGFRFASDFAGFLAQEGLTTR